MGDVTNNGDVLVNDEDSVFSKGGGGGVFTNNNIVTIDAAANLTLGFGGFFTQALGTLTNNGSFNLGNETFTYDGGIINGEIRITGGRLNLNATGAATFRLLGSAAGSRTLNGNVAAGQVIYVEAVDATAASWTWEGGPTVTNSGMIILTNTVPTGTGTTTLQAAAGTPIEVAPGGTIDLQADGGNKTLLGDVTNNGSVLVNDEDTMFSKGGGGAVFTNNKIVTIDAAANLSSVFGDTFTQAGGTLTIHGTLTMGNDTFNFVGGNIAGGGTATLTNTTVLGVGDANIDVSVPQATIDLARRRAAQQAFLTSTKKHLPRAAAIGRKTPARHSRSKLADRHQGPDTISSTFNTSPTLVARSIWTFCPALPLTRVKCSKSLRTAPVSARFPR